MSDELDDWRQRRSLPHQRWTVTDVLALKAASGQRVSVVIPAKNEAATIAGVVRGIRAELVDAAPVVDELVVIDSDSADDTAVIAARAGAQVHRSEDIPCGLAPVPGKGEAMWRSLFVTTGDLVVFVDGDLTEWGPHFVTGLLGPLLEWPEVLLVKGFYDRPVTGTDAASDGRGAMGGRVTELVARPLMALHWPALAGLVQPLAGEWAARRSLLETLRMPTGYGVELAALVDTVSAHGIDALAQVDLGRRAHQHSSLLSLGAMATELLAIAQSRLDGVEVAAREVELLQYGVGSDRGRPVPRRVQVAERPPASSLPAYSWRPKDASAWPA